MDATYVEPGCCIVGTWDNGTDFQETWYDTYYCDELDCDIISDENNELISDVQRDDYSNLITLSDAIKQINSDEDFSPETKSELIQEIMVLGYANKEEWIVDENCPNVHYSDFLDLDVLKEEPSDNYIELNGTDSWITFEEYKVQMQQSMVDALPSTKVTIVDEVQELTEYFNS